MVRAPNQGARRMLLTSREGSWVAARAPPTAAQTGSYFAPVAFAYFLRNLSTRPAVSTIFCLPV